MKELEENTIEQIRTLLNYLEQTDLLKNKDILRCLDVIAREYGGEAVSYTHLTLPTILLV